MEEGGNGSCEDGKSTGADTARGSPGSTGGDASCASTHPMHSSVRSRRSVLPAARTHWRSSRQTSSRSTGEVVGTSADPSSLCLSPTLSPYPPSDPRRSERSPGGAATAVVSTTSERSKTTGSRETSTPRDASALRRLETPPDVAERPVRRASSVCEHVSSKRPAPSGRQRPVVTSSSTQPTRRRTLAAEIRRGGAMHAPGRSGGFGDVMSAGRSTTDPTP